MNMTTQLKNNLIHRIENINDIHFLQAIQTILDSSNKELYQLTDEQKSSIEISRSQLDKGEYLEHSEVIRNLDQWLKNK